MPLTWGDRKYLDAHLERQELLYENAPACPNCKSVQVQLVNSFAKPAKWKCRMCRHAFTFEPEQKK